jgi:hypothetical protein
MVEVEVGVEADPLEEEEAVVVEEQVEETTTLDLPHPSRKDFVLLWVSMCSASARKTQLTR